LYFSNKIKLKKPFLYKYFDKKRVRKERLNSFQSIFYTLYFILKMKFEQYELRLLQIEDLQSYFDLVRRNRKRLEDFFTGTVSRTQTFEDTQAFVTEIIQKAETRLYFPYLLVDTVSNELLGFFDLKNIDWNTGKAEIGFYMDEAQAGKGIATKALNCLVHYGFSFFKFQKMFLRTHPENLPARKMAEKCGFEIEGIIRHNYKTTSGKLVDLVYYGKLA
jgi:RimJ/RimL family protein N-acetyltransferase